MLAIIEIAGVILVTGLALLFIRFLMGVFK